MLREFTLCLDFLELPGLDETQAYERGYDTGLVMDYRSERTIGAARSDVVAFGLLVYEKWEKTGDFKYVLAHEYIRGLNHGLRQKAEKIAGRNKVKSDT